MTIEGSFRIEGDPVWMENLLRFAKQEPREEQTYEVTLTSSHQIPCPSIWRHPIQWLRWNPLMTTRLSYTMKGVTLDRSDNSAITFHPPLLVSEAH